MCKNTPWRGSLPDWKNELTHLVRKKDVSLTRTLTLLFDAKPIFGDNGLYDELEDFAFDLLSKNQAVLAMLVDEPE